MAIQIVNEGSNLKITIDSVTRFIAKSTIKSVKIVGTNVLKLNTGEGCCTPSEYLPYASVTVPTSANIDALMTQVAGWLEPDDGGGSFPTGLATEAKQTDNITKLNEVKTAIATNAIDIAASVTTNLTGKATVAKQDEISTKLTTLNTSTTTVNTSVGAVTTAVGAANTAITNSITSNLTGKATVVKQDEISTKLTTLNSSTTTIGSNITTSVDAAKTGIKDSFTQYFGKLQAVANIYDLLFLMEADLSVLTADNVVIKNALRLPISEPLREHALSSEIKYEGFANPGALNNANEWAIRKTVCEPDGQITRTWAGAANIFNNKWTDHLTLSYT